MNPTNEPKPPEKILIIEDMPESLQLLSSFLSKYGYEVTCVTDGKVALQVIRAVTPDLILSDIMLPTINGYKVCELIRSQPHTSQIPFIFVSGLDSEVDRVEAFKVGAADYITKPFFIEDVMARIRYHLKTSGERRKLQQLLRQKSEEKQAVELELERTRVFLHGVLDSSIDGVAVFEVVRNVRGKIVDFKWLLANTVASVTVGETKENLIGKRLFAEQTSKNLFVQLRDSFIRVVETCTVLDREYYYNSASLKTWIQVVAVKLGDGFAMTFRDISDRKQTEIALEAANVKLQSQVNYDTLTKVFNRRRFNEYISSEWSRCAREEKYLSLILCDIDYFKAFNDTYGHQSGDRCLYRVAQAISQGIQRPADLVFRYGGEEFAVILPNTDSTGAVRVAEQIRLNIKQLQIPHQSSEIGEFVSLSLGISSMIPLATAEHQTLIAAADRALYQAKAQGRDRVFADCD